MPKVDRLTKHFVIDLDRPVSPAVWLVLSRGLEERLLELGYDLDVFNDCCDADRQWVLEQDEINFFEGLVSHPRKMDEAEIVAAMADFLAAREFAAANLELDDELEEPSVDDK